MDTTTYVRPAARERDLMPSEMSDMALVDLRDELTSKISCYRTPAWEDKVALEIVMVEINYRRKSA